MSIPSRKVVGCGILCLVGLFFIIRSEILRSARKARHAAARHEREVLNGMLHEPTAHAARILREKCSECHGPDLHEAGLRLDTLEEARKGSRGGLVVVPNESGRSLLMEVLGGAGSVARMPPSGPPLNEGEIAVLRAWIDGGASAPSSPTVEAPSQPQSKHWAFQPVGKPLPAGG